jgi:RNA polymerase sigma-70 factor, ECF subfamily
VLPQSSNDQNIAAPSFASLVEACYAPLFRFAMSLTRQETDAADLVQETFLKWAAKGHQLQDSRKAKGWLFTTLHRTFLEGQRRGQRFPHLELDAAAGEIPMVEPECVQALEAQEVMHLLAQVDPQFRAAVALFYIEDYSYQEISEITEVPLGTVKSRIARGLVQLKSLVLERSASHWHQHLKKP